MLYILFVNKYSIEYFNGGDVYESVVCRITRTKFRLITLERGKIEMNLLTCDFTTNMIIKNWRNNHEKQ